MRHLHPHGHGDHVHEDRGQKDHGPEVHDHGVYAHRIHDQETHGLVLARDPNIFHDRTRLVHHGVTLILHAVHVPANQPSRRIIQTATQKS